MLARLQPQLAFEASTGHAAFAESGRDDDRRTDALATAVADDLGNRRRRRQDHRQVGCRREVEDAAMGRLPGDRLVPRIDEVDRPGEAAFAEVAPDDVTQRAGGIAGADQCDRRGLEEGRNALGSHESSGMSADLPAHASFILQRVHPESPQAEYHHARGVHFAPGVPPPPDGRRPPGTARPPGCNRGAAARPAAARLPRAPRSAPRERRATHARPSADARRAPGRTFARRGTRARRSGYGDVPGHVRGRAAGGRRERARHGPGRDRRGPPCVLQRAAAGPSRGARAGDGLLLLQQRRGRRRARARASRTRARRDPGFRRAPRQRHRGHLPRRPARADLLELPVSALSRQQPRLRARTHRQLPAATGERQRRLSRGGDPALAAGARAICAADDLHLGWLRRPRRRRSRGTAPRRRPTTAGSPIGPAKSPRATRTIASSRRSRAATSCPRSPRAPSRTSTG